MTENTVAFSKENGKNWLKTLLSERIVTIDFIKKDGSARTMNCTLSENKIPAQNAPKGSGKAKSEEALAVFDVEKQEWRSFRWDSITRTRFDIDGK